MDYLMQASARFALSSTDDVAELAIGVIASGSSAAGKLKPEIDGHSLRCSPRGERQYWIVSEAELEGERIRATLAAPGSDWMWVSDDGFWRPDVRAPFKTHDGATVLMH